MRPEAYPCIRQAADQGVIVEFGDGIDEEINRRVVGLDDDLSARPIAGVIETIPTYRSLFVRYDPLRVRAATLMEHLRQRMSSSLTPARHGRLWRVPALYGGADGQDLDEVARLHDLTTDEVVALHCGARYRVYMIGFMPGFAYLGGLPEALHTPRLANPRPVTPASGLTIGGVQASISSMESPSGWRYIGRTPVRLFDPQRDPAILLHAGDEICFEPIGPGEAERLDAISESGGVPATCDLSP